MLSAYAIALHGFERLLPTPLPWLRFGLANIISLSALILYGLKPAMTITLIRVVIGSFLAGTFLGPAFALSLGAGVVSTLGMGLTLSVAPALFSPVGVSLIGALLHNMTQLFLAYLLFIGRVEVVVILTPVILITGVVTGALNGIASGMLVRGIRKRQQPAGGGDEPPG